MEAPTRQTVRWNWTRGKRVKASDESGPTGQPGPTMKVGGAFITGPCQEPSDYFLERKAWDRKVVYDPSTGACTGSDYEQSGETRLP